MLPLTMLGIFFTVPVVVVLAQMELADLGACRQTVELGILEPAPPPQINPMKPTIAGYMPKKFTNIRTDIGTKSLYMKTGEAARLLDNKNLLTRDDHDQPGGSINQKLTDPTTKSDADKRSSVHECGAPLQQLPLQILHHAQPSDPSRLQRFGRPSEDDGVRILESDAACSICLDSFQDPRKNPIGESEWQLISSCPRCMACYHRDCLASWFLDNNTCPCCHKSFAIIPTNVMQRIDDKLWVFSIRLVGFIVLVMLLSIMKDYCR
ncbi:hypothetical protein PGTUg99_035751 [Puccinia graminis f. sp. tritici]|uniref:RING-type domain-containing protein n=1 Tax=Puccinia graminis f. sp. tritici TaxID=56615 RepID=A0A5B0P3B1_PUCGR|nr:hypothetical protein PGTUg99_035751 [Puccinia graminis f. sp. tritici]